jgi:TPP-dependent pyruvate/acetoin dehydrogenase alpha subunit
MPDEAMLLRLYGTMALIRRFEERVRILFRANKLPGFVHLSLGQEAVAAGVCDVLRDSDIIATTHRCHGHVLAKGADLNGLFAELYGKASGVCRGVGGSMHLSDPDHGVLCANAIVGASIGLATGAAFSFQLRGEDGVAVAFFGDGATNTGSFHESLNLAALWELPVVFVCENNQYAEMTPAASQTLLTDLSARAAAYGMPGRSIDGNDVLAVRAAAATAVERGRSGGGPTLLECRTLRLAGHYEGDQERYRPEGERDEWTLRDPVARARSEAVAAGVDEDRLQAAEGEVDGLIDAAVTHAEADAYPSADLLRELTYEEVVP